MTSVKSKKQKMNQKLLTSQQEPRTDLSALIKHHFNFLATFQCWLCVRHTSRDFPPINSLTPALEVDFIIIFRYNCNCSKHKPYLWDGFVINHGVTYPCTRTCTWKYTIDWNKKSCLYFFLSFNQNLVSINSVSQTGNTAVNMMELTV